MQRKFTEAEKCFKKAVELNDSDISAHRSLAAFYTNTNRRGLALKEWEKILELNPEDKQAKSIIEQMKVTRPKVKD